MIISSDLEKIKKIVQEFFQKMTFDVEIECSTQKTQTFPITTPTQYAETILIKVKTEEPQVLIGERGQTLIEIQQILKSLLKRKITTPFFIDLDINDYKKKKIEYLKELARSVADEVALTKQEKILAQMPAYERRIIHLELAERKDVTTESIGEEPERRVVIRPYP